MSKLVPVVLIVMTPLILLLGLAVGPVFISAEQFFELLPYIFSNQVPVGSTPSQTELTSLSIIIADIRLPRTLLAWLIGAALAISGAAMQGLFRNPLADPSIIGVTSGASLGASITVVMLGASVEQFGGLSMLVLGAFIGGLLAVLLVYSLSTGSGIFSNKLSYNDYSSNGTSVATMLLVGIAITALAGASNSMLAYISDDEMLRRISLWNMGGLDAANGLRVKLALLVILPAMLLLLGFWRQLDAMLLGESEARHLGVDVQRVKWILIVLVAIAVASSVALAGVIGFVGLVVPHMLRMLIGPGHARLLPCSALAGGLLLVAADILARVVVSPAELPVGVITAILGAPLFIVLLRHRRGYGLV